MLNKTYSCDDFVNVKEYQDLAVGYFGSGIYAVRQLQSSNYPIFYHNFHKISENDFHNFPHNFNSLKKNICEIGAYRLCNDFKRKNYPNTPTGLQEFNTFTKQNYDSININIRHYHCRTDFTTCKGGKMSYVGYFGDKTKKLYAHLRIAHCFPRGNDTMSFCKISEQEFNDFPQNEEQLVKKLEVDFKKYHLVDDYTTWTFTEEDYNKMIL